MNVRSIILSLFFVSVLSFQLSAQTVALPDPNLIAKLQADYPSVMQGDELIIAQANARTGTLNLKGANIDDATGIEHFTQINTLDITDNNLTTIPDMSATTGLINFYAGLNDLTAVPDLSSLTNLKDFQVHDNELTALPNLPTSIERIYCGKNLIEDMPDFSMYPNLIHLVIGDNPLAEQLDYSQLTNLEELHIHKLGVKDSINGLSQLVNLKVLFAWGNEITDFSAIDSNEIMTTCVISDNQLTSLPYLANKPSLNYLDFSYNYLSFEDIIPVTQAVSPLFFIYNNQRVRPLENLSERAMAALTISSNIPEYPGNSYVLKKDGITVDSSSQSSYTITYLTEADAGTYSYKVYNTDQTDVVLTSPSFQVSVEACMDVNLKSEIDEKDCTKGYTLNLTNSIYEGGQSPYTYHFASKTYDEIYEGETIKEIPAGTYDITISDARGCTAESTLSLNRIERCDPVFSPNGDGYSDTYFIEDSGKVQIFDTSRQLVTELQAPIVWDGNAADGSPVDAGYYVLVVENEKVIYLTLVR